MYIYVRIVEPSIICIIVVGIVTVHYVKDQSEKKWQSTINKQLFAVPYSHITFTMPHVLNGLTKSYKKVMYDILFSSVKGTIEKVYADKKNVGGKAGLICVLHTWGSDMKYHVHVHCLVTFGGLSKENKWIVPKRKKTIAPYRVIAKIYKELFLEQLKKAFESKVLVYRNDYQYYEQILLNKRWVVNQQPPQIDTSILEEYLSRYICRSAISPRRLRYIKKQKKVEISYKEYSKQEKGKPAPIGIKRIDPLVAINMILQHKLPPYYHRCRYYGLHATCLRKKIKELIPKSIQRKKGWIKQLFELLTILFNITKDDVLSCPSCGGINIIKKSVSPDRNWLSEQVKGYKLKLVKNKAPPNQALKILNIKGKIQYGF